MDQGLQVNPTAAFALTRHCLPLLDRAPDIVVFVRPPGRGARVRRRLRRRQGRVEQMAIRAAELRANPHLRVNTYDPTDAQRHAPEGLSGNRSNARRCRTPRRRRCCGCSAPTAAAPATSAYSAAGPRRTPKRKTPPGGVFVAMVPKTGIEPATY